MTSTNVTLKNRLIDHLTNNWRSYVFYLIVLFSIVLFIFALGYSTAWARTEVLGKSYRETQPIFDLTKSTNDTILVLSSVGLLSSVLGLMLGTHNRKKYYWTNYVLLSVVVVFSLITGIYIMIGSNILRAEFANSFQTYEDEWNYLIQLSFQSNDIRPGILESLDSVLPFVLVGIITFGLGVWLLVDELIHHKVYVQREQYVEEMLRQVEAGLIKVSDKVMNQIPTVDDDVIDFTDKEILEFSHAEKGQFYSKHQTSLKISYIWAQIVTLLLFLSVVATFVIDTLYKFGVLSKDTVGFTGIEQSLIGFLSIIILLVACVNLMALKAIKQVEEELTPRNTLIGFAIFLIPSTLISGMLLLPVALKLPRSKVEISKMRYQANGLAYGLTFVSMLFFLWSLFTSINYSLFTGLADEIRVKPDFNIALDITISIVLVLAMFLAAEKVKSYSKKWSFGLFAISAINIARLFYVPLISLNTNQIPNDIFVQIALSHIISAVLTLAAGFISLNKSTKLEKAIKAGGK